MIDALKEHIQSRDESKIVNFISTNPEVLNLKDSNGSSGLFLIAYSGLTVAFNQAKEIKQSFDFHEAIICGELQRVKDLIQQDQSLVNTYSDDGFSPLSLAAFFDQSEIAEYLLKNNSNPNLAAKNPSGVNALHSAVAKENYELCKLLLEFDVDVNATQMNNVTALHSATHRGNLALVKLLVEHGANIDIEMKNGNTAPSIAKEEGRTEVALFLENFLKAK